MDDYVLDWKNGFAFSNPDHTNGFTLREGMAQPQDFSFVASDSAEPQVVSMIRQFATTTQEPQGETSKRAQALALLTQELLDSYWQAVEK